MGSAANFGPQDYQIGAMPGGSNPFQPGNGGGYDQRTFDLQPGDGQGWGGNQVGGHFGFMNTPGDMGGNGLNVAPSVPGGYDNPMFNGPGTPIPPGGGGTMIPPGYGTGQGGGWYGGGAHVQPQPWQPVQNPGMPPSQPPQAGWNTDKPFASLEDGTLQKIRGHIQASGGKMGRAKQAFEQGGGTWSKDIHKRLKNKYA